MSDETPVATLAFLSFPGPKAVCINLQIEGKDVKAEITRRQLEAILLAGARKLFDGEEK